MTEAFNSEDDAPDVFEQASWNFNQFLIWLARREAGPVLYASDAPLSPREKPLSWGVYSLGALPDPKHRRRIEAQALRAMERGRITPSVNVGGSVQKPIPGWFEGMRVELLNERDNFAAVLVRGPLHMPEKFHPRFDPRRVRQLYPALHSPAERDTPEFENPLLGPFIAYADVLKWLCLRISIEISIAVDDALEAAERFIRTRCLNEELHLLGLKAGAEAEGLQDVSPRVLHNLHLDALTGQPESDLRLLGYQREYGSAIHGAGGPVAWTGLCFDRREVLKAFPLGRGLFEMPKPPQPEIKPLTVVRGRGSPPPRRDTPAAPATATAAAEPKPVVRSWRRRGNIRKFAEVLRDVRTWKAEKKLALTMKPKGRRGRKHKYDWPKIRKEAFDLLEHHGGISPDDPELPNQEALVSLLLMYCEREWQQAPSPGHMREHVSKWLMEHAAGQRK